MDTKIRVSTKKLTFGSFDYESGALTTELPLPHVCMYADKILHFINVLIIVIYY